MKKHMSSKQKLIQCKQRNGKSHPAAIKQTVWKNPIGPPPHHMQMGVPQTGDYNTTGLERQEERQSLHRKSGGASVSISTISAVA